MNLQGKRDYSGIRLTQHALERFTERFGVAPELAESELRSVLKVTRRIGRNPDSGAIAVLTLHQRRTLVAILQEEKACLTVMTWPQFHPRMREFGRWKIPRKRGRWLRRLIGGNLAEGLDPPPFIPLESELDH